MQNLLQPSKILFNDPIFYLLKQANIFLSGHCSGLTLYTLENTLDLEAWFNQQLMKGVTGTYPHPTTSGAEVCKWHSSEGFLRGLQQFSKCSIKESLRTWSAEFKYPPFHSPAYVLRKYFTSL